MLNNSKILRDLIEKKSLVKVCGAYDAMSAKLVEIHGFDAVWAGSFAISATHGVPDSSILTMTEFFDAAFDMVGICKIPVIADCDTGYGGPDNVRRMVKKYESAGVAAVCIEDKIFPKQNSLLKDGKNDLISEREFAEKIIAAKETKQNKDFMIIARVEALISGAGMDEALKRATAYEQAGADAILIHSKKETPKEIFQFSDLWKGNLPIVIVPTTYGTVTNNELISHKIKIVIHANHTLRAAHAAMSRVLKEMINSNSLSEIKENISSMEDIFELQYMYDNKSKEKVLEEKLKKLGNNN